ncbi:hypothetical protein BH10ACT1_BH10ACT1_25400 [soil metagenome]
MAFGQQNGRPATARQLKTLEVLLGDAGYSGFRDARGPMGFSQRQGGGKFTTDEADAYIEQLEAEAEAGVEAGSGLAASEAPPAVAPRAATGRKATPVPKAPAGVAKGVVAAPVGSTATERREARQGALVRDLPAKVLARELERRGWILIPPEDLTAADPTAAPKDA